jgi:hypothetical protein
MIRSGALTKLREPSLDERTVSQLRPFFGSAFSIGTPPMRPFFALVFRSVVAASAAILLGSCGGSGDTTTVAYSGVIEGYQCNDYYMVLALEESGAELAKRRGGIACELGPELEGRGCRFFADEVSDPDQLRVVLLDCPFDLSEVLFRCDYTEADVESMNRWTYAGCCFNRNSHDGYCEELPVCFTDEETGASCEDCYNSIDDDGDGLVDCEDRLCREVPECEPPTTSTTSTTTTTVSTSTTTTIPFYRYGCYVHFRLMDFESPGSLRWTTDYSQAWTEHAVDAFDCESGVDGATLVSSEDVVEKNLSLELTRPESIEGPVDLAKCWFLATEYVAGDDFAVTEVEAATTDLEPIVPPPGISVIFVECAWLDSSNVAGTLASPAPR